MKFQIDEAMIDPMTALALGQAALGVGQMVKGAIQGGSKAPQMIIPKSATAALNVAQAQAGQTKMPGQDIMEDKLAMAAASAANRVMEMTGGGAAGLGAMANINQGLSKSLGDMAYNQANYVAGQKQNLQGQLNNMAQWEQQQFQMNEYQPWLQKMESAKTLKDSGMQNLWGAASGYVQGQQTKKMWDDYINQQKLQMDLQKDQFAQQMALWKQGSGGGVINGAPNGFAPPPQITPNVVPSQSVQLGTGVDPRLIQTGAMPEGSDVFQSKIPMWNWNTPSFNQGGAVNGQVAPPASVVAPANPVVVPTQVQPPPQTKLEPVAMKDINMEFIPNIPSGGNVILPPIQSPKKEAVVEVPQTKLEPVEMKDIEMDFTPKIPKGKNVTLPKRKVKKSIDIPQTKLEPIEMKDIATGIEPNIKDIGEVKLQPAIIKAKKSEPASIDIEKLPKKEGREIYVPKKEYNGKDWVDRSPEDIERDIKKSTIKNQIKDKETLEEVKEGTMKIGVSKYVDIFDIIPNGEKRKTLDEGIWIRDALATTTMDQVNTAIGPPPKMPSKEETIKILEKGYRMCSYKSCESDRFGVVEENGKYKLALINIPEPYKSLHNEYVVKYINYILSLAENSIKARPQKYDTKQYTPEPPKKITQ